MNFQVDDMKVLGAVEGGGRTIKNVKETSRLDKNEVEKILEFLMKSQLIEAVEGKGIWGQTQYYFNTTDEGSQKVKEYIEYLKDEWKKIIQYVTDGQREELDVYMKENKYLVNMMLFFKMGAGGGGGGGGRGGSRRGGRKRGRGGGFRPPNAGNRPSCC